MPWALIVAACLGGFAATSSGTTRAPFLVAMAQDLDTTVPLIANLFALTAIAWGISSLAAGFGSDRWGRRPFLIGGPIALTIAMVGVALAHDYWSVALWATLGGGASGIFVGTLFAEVAARTSASHRGRALGWVMGGQSLTLVVGVPLATLVGDAVGWRGVNVCVALLAFVAAISLAVTSMRGPAGGASPADKRFAFTDVFSSYVARLLGMVIAERICFGLAAVFFATFLLQSYDISQGALAIPLAVFALGNLLGTGLGGPLADRTTNRLRAFALAMAASAVAAMALFLWRPDLPLSVALGFSYMFLNGLGRPSLMAVLASVPEEVRGTVMGLNGTCASIGWIGAAWIGAFAFALAGFSAFGPLVGLLAIAAVVLAMWRS